MRAYNVQGHKVQYDMESMLYVVLYCGLLCLPHRLDGNMLRDILRDFFDSHSLGSGLPTGGYGKITNRHTRSLTSTINWRGNTMFAWVEAMLTSLHPLTAAVRPGQRLPWEPQAVETWWANFLRDHSNELGTNDATDNIRESWGVFRNLAPNILRPLPNQGTQASPPHARPLAGESGDESAGTGQANHSTGHGPTFRRAKQPPSSSRPPKRGRGSPSDHSGSESSSRVLDGDVPVPSTTGSFLSSAPTVTTEDDHREYSPVMEGWQVPSGLSESTTHGTNAEGGRSSLTGAASGPSDDGTVTGRSITHAKKKRRRG